MLPFWKYATFFKPCFVFGGIHISLIMSSCILVVDGPHKQPEACFFHAHLKARSRTETVEPSIKGTPNKETPLSVIYIYTRQMHGILVSRNDPPLCTVLCAAKIHASGAVVVHNTYTHNKRLFQISDSSSQHAAHIFRNAHRHVGVFKH